MPKMNHIEIVKDPHSYLLILLEEEKRKNSNDLNFCQYSACNQTLEKMAAFMGEEWQKFLHFIKNVYEQQIAQAQWNVITSDTENHPLKVNKKELENSLSELKAALALKDEQINQLTDKLKVIDDLGKNMESVKSIELNSLKEEIGNLQVELSSEKDARKLLIGKDKLNADKNSSDNSEQLQNGENSSLSNNSAKISNKKDSKSCTIVVESLKKEWKSNIKVLIKKFDELNVKIDEKYQKLDLEISSVLDKVSAYQKKKPMSPEEMQGLHSMIDELVDKISTGHIEFDNLSQYLSRADNSMIIVEESDIPIFKFLRAVRKASNAIQMYKVLQPFVLLKLIKESRDKSSKENEDVTKFFYSLNLVNDAKNFDTSLEESPNVSYFNHDGSFTKLMIESKELSKKASNALWNCLDKCQQSHIVQDIQNYLPKASDAKNSAIIAEQFNDKSKKVLQTIHFNPFWMLRKDS
ncbi:MAG: hypothetical protein MHMPM18_003244 [Marteilia pararefringens]